MQRNRHNQNRIAGHAGRKSGDNLGQHPSQNVRCRTHQLILQQMNKFAKSAIIAAIGCGLLEGRNQAPAQSADGFPVPPRESVRAAKRLATERTNPFSGRTNVRKTLSAYWKAGNIDERSATDAAFRREKSRKQRRGNPAYRRDRGSHQRVALLDNLGLGGPGWVPTTAEDEPPSSGRCCGGSMRTNPLQYSGGECAAQSPQRFRQPRAARARTILGVPSLR